VRRGRVLLVLVAAAFAVAGGVAAGLLWVQRSLERPVPLREPVVVDVPRGAGTAAILERLAQAGVIEHPWLVRAALALSGRNRMLRAGEYRFEPGMTVAAAIEKMVRGEVLLHRVTIPEGLTVHEVYALLENNPILSGDLPQPPPEGSLLPETWMVPRGYPRRLLVLRMQAAMEEALAEAWAARDPDLPLASPRELLTIASIVEKETPLAAEYARIAGVYVNRLRRGMKLQADPTVIYALTRGRRPLGRGLTHADLAVDDPYNTYLHPGLPPGPIANPGRAALMAAARPERHDFLYFVANGTGGHDFAEDLRTHHANVRNWRRVRRSGVERVPVPVPRPERGPEG